MKSFLTRLKVNTWLALEACLDYALSLVNSEKVLGQYGTTRRLVSLSLLISTVLFFCSIPVYIAGLVNTIRGK